MAKSEFRTRTGSVGAIAAVAVLAIVGVAASLLEAGFRTWTVGRYFENRASLFVDGFIIAALCSVITLTFSVIGKGRNRIIGIVSSLGSIALVIFILLLNK